MSSLKEAINIIKKRKKGYYLVLLIIFLLLFFQFFLAGQDLYRTDKEKAEKFIEMISNTTKIKIIANLFGEERYVVAGTLIFLNNFLINSISMYAGIIILVPIFIFFSNSIITGLIFGIESLMYPATISHVLLLLIIFILEIFSFILVTYEGLRIGMSLINPKIFKKKKRRDALKQNFKEGTKILFLVMLILIIAAIIETFGIVLLGSGFIS